MAVLVVGILLGLALRDTIQHLDRQACGRDRRGGGICVGCLQRRDVEYKNRRRKQIQIEEGTWVAADWMPEGRREGFSLKASGDGSKANSYASLAFAIGVVVFFVALAFSQAISGHWISGVTVSGRLCGVFVSEHPCLETSTTF